MTPTDFMVARTIEALDAMSCDYVRVGDRVICYCGTLAEPVEDALDDLDLVRWGEARFGPENVIAALLAAHYATHPDYDPAWRSIVHLG